MTTFGRVAGDAGLVGVCARVTLLLCLGCCGAFAARRQAAATRHLVWLGVIIGILAVPLITVIPSVRIGVLPIESAAIEPAAPLDARVVALWRPAAASGIHAIRGQPLIPRIGTIAGYVWLLGTVAQLLWIFATIRSVAGIVRRGRPLHSTDWTSTLADAAVPANAGILPRLVASSEVETAFVVGVLTPVIVVPGSAEEWSDDRWRAVLLHELAHVRRRDLIGHAIANLACAVYWFNPIVWIAARRLRVESELAADDAVLASGVLPADYAQHLLDIVASLSHRAPVTTLAIARPSEFEGRLVAILDRSKRRMTLGLTQRRTLIAVLGLVTFSIAAIAPARRAIATYSHAGIVARLHYGTAGIINPMLMLLDAAGSLELTESQADSIATLNRLYMIGLSAIWSPVPDRYAPLHASHDDRSAMAVFRQASRASIDLLLRTVPSVSGLLTPDQRRRLPAGIAMYLDRGNLMAIGTEQDGRVVDVFFPDGAVIGRPAPRQPHPGMHQEEVPLSKEH